MFIQRSAAVILVLLLIILAGCDPETPPAEASEYTVTISTIGTAAGESLMASVEKGVEGTVVILTAAIKTMNTRIALSADGGTLSASEITADGGTATFTIPAANAEITAVFGVESILRNSVPSESFFGGAVDADGDTVAIGAIELNDRKGAVCVFRKYGNLWAREAELTVSEGQALDSFGHSVAIDGDTIVAGAVCEEEAAGGANDNNGAAYVFVRSGTSWSRQAKLLAGDSQIGDNFGQSVTISGDTIVVGAHLEDGGPGDTIPEAGAAYVFTRTGTSWSQSAKLTASVPEADDKFGASLDLENDSLVVGAWELRSASPYAPGTAFVFKRNAGAWDSGVELSTSDVAVGSMFGNSVAISGNTVIVGAKRDDGGTEATVSQCGSAFVFVYDGTNYNREAILIASDRQASDNFGDSVSLDGDTAVIGAPSEDGGTGDGASNQGAAYVFKRSGAVWSQQANIYRGTGAGDRFGTGLSVNGADVFIGASLEDGGDGDPVTYAGAAYCYGL